MNSIKIIKFIDSKGRPVFRTKCQEDTITRMWRWINYISTFAFIAVFTIIFVNILIRHYDIVIGLFSGVYETFKYALSEESVRNKYLGF